MRSFKTVEALALKHHSKADIEKDLSSYKPKSKAALRKLGDDRWLAQLMQCVFNAGFNWRVIEAKWPGFEEAFWRFDVARCAMMSDGDLDRVLKDTRIVRNPLKILSIRDNAVFLKDLAAEHGSAAKFFADWPDEDFAGLLEMMGKRGSRLGGGTAMMALRFIGKPAFLLRPDVVTALIREGVIEKEPKGKAAMRKVQEAFNAWSAETGRDLTALSRLLALSVG